MKPPPPVITKLGLDAVIVFFVIPSEIEESRGSTYR
jgi:hypothetical protein